jgi:hypothetical protein
MKRFSLLTLAIGLCLPALADEGMWLFNQFPKERVSKKYGVDISQPLLDHLRLSSVRVGASGSFVSPNGLIFTNHHVVLGCVQNISTPQKDYVADGFYAKSMDEEKKCPGSEANVLLTIQDITAQVNAAVKANPHSAEGNRQRKAELVRFETECSERTGNNCQSVTLYGGAQYHLYEYKKYTDVRLVFAPEFQIGFFGGDPDNFTYPRYNLDIGFYRVYENGRPARTPHYLKWSPEGVKNRDFVLVSGNPGRTERLLTLAELEYYRDVTFPFTLKRLDSAITALKKYSAQSEENERAAKDTIFSLENTYKAMKGRYAGLQNKRLMGQKRTEEQKLRDAVRKDPAKRAQYGNTWNEVAGAVKQMRANYVRRILLEGGPLGSHLFMNARGVLRLPEELAKPPDQRLREYGGSALASLRNRLFSPIPIAPTKEEVVLADYFRLLRSEFGANDSIVKAVLDGKTPEDAARAYVNGSRMGDVEARKRLSASVEAVRESDDSMLRLVRILDPEARRLRKQAEDGPEAVLSAAVPKLAEARFAVYGPNEAPDATFTLRLSFGEVRGYENERGQDVPYTTKLAGLYERATGQLPYVLPESWIRAKGKLDLDTPMNYVSTADIIGGNSGSPTVNSKGEIVGIVFDGNIESLPAHFAYSEERARAVHVASQIIVEALSKVYETDRLLDELGLGSSRVRR